MTDAERIEKLEAETGALRIVLLGVLTRLGDMDPKWRSNILDGLTRAAESCRPDDPALAEALEDIGTDFMRDS